MHQKTEVWREQIDKDGFSILPGVFSAAVVDALLIALSQVFLSMEEDTAVRSDAGSVYAARNVLTA